MRSVSEERAIVCPDCGHRVYPRVVPAVTVAVIDREKDRLLLTRYAGRDIPFYALVAGFTEIGETLEQTVSREVREETGLSVKNIRYFGSVIFALMTCFGAAQEYRLFSSVDAKYNIFLIF